MPETTSSTLIKSSIIPIDQTLSVDQHLKVKYPEIDYTLQASYHRLFHILYAFGENTNDGGVRLRKSLPKPDWTCRIYGDRVIMFFQQTTSSEELLTKTTNSWLAWKQTSRSSPQLDAIQWIKEATGLSQERIGRLVNVSRQTIINWENGYPITDTHQQSLFAVRDVLERAARRHPDQIELKAWLDTPHGTDGRTPAQLLEAKEINRARLLAMSSPSPHLTRPPDWVNHSIPKTFHTRTEHHQEAWPPDTDDELVDFIKNEEDSTDEDGEEFPLR
jgi:DNA-binding XRE family transcriptional regulator